MVYLVLKTRNRHLIFALRILAKRFFSHPRVELGLTSYEVEFEKAEAQAFRV